LHIYIRYRAIPCNFSNINTENLIKEINEVLMEIEKTKLNEKLGPLGIGVEYVISDDDGINMSAIF